MSGCVAGGAALIILMAAHHHNDVVVNVTPSISANLSQVSPMVSPEWVAAMEWPILLFVCGGVLLWNIIAFYENKKV
jgi:hypothetical protein